MPNTPGMSPQIRHLVDASAAIREAPTTRPDYLHTVMCQVGLPRKRTDARVFQRSSGNTTIALEAGRLMLGGKLQEQSLPYGPHPRLVMVYISSEAVRTRNRVIDIGSSTREFLRRLEISSSGGRGGGLTAFKKHMMALAACKLTLGYSWQDHDVTINTVPIERFEAWINHDDKQTVMWPGIIELSQRFFDTLTDHAVPLDPRALGALKHSSLALDMYSWLAHRLYRIRDRNGTFLSWTNLMEQFGQEYTDAKYFRREFLRVLRQVHVVYPDARIEVVRGGLRLYASKPPVPKTQVVVELPPANSPYIPWKDRTDLLDPNRN